MSDPKMFTSKDLKPIISNWPSESGQINVRKIRGENNQVKIQMRVDLGVLQIEPHGRPDGRRPHNCESLLEYHQKQCAIYIERNGTDLGFVLNAEECQDLREEAVQYYKRYLANFVLEDYEAVIRDTQRNLDLLDFCAKYAENEADQLAMEQYRPYIIMMNARSKGLLSMDHGAYRTALVHVENGLTTIKNFFERFGMPHAYRMSGEVQVLKALRRQVRGFLPVDPIRKLKSQLNRALRDERYEDAARLRDELNTLLQEPKETI